MDLKTFIAPLTLEQRQDFAAKCETTKGHLQNVMYGLKSCATDLAVLIERHSDGAVRRWNLRPDDWFKHWPEIVGAPGAPDCPEIVMQQGVANSASEQAATAVTGSGEAQQPTAVREGIVRRHDSRRQHDQPPDAGRRKNLPSPVLDTATQQVN